MNESWIAHLLSYVRIIYAGALGIAFAIDTACIIKARKIELLKTDKYLSFHTRHGILKTTMLKLCVSVFLIHDLFEPALKVGAILTIITGYILTVFRFASRYRKLLHDGNTCTTNHTASL